MQEGLWGHQEQNQRTSSSFTLLYQFAAYNCWTPRCYQMSKQAPQWEFPLSSASCQKITPPSYQTQTQPRFPGLEYCNSSQNEVLHLEKASTGTEQLTHLHSNIGGPEDKCLSTSPWCSVPGSPLKRVHFKVSEQSFKVLHGTGPPCLRDCLTIYNHEGATFQWNHKKLSPSGVYMHTTRCPGLNYGTHTLRRYKQHGALLL